jgi:hypothetical protein
VATGWLILWALFLFDTKRPIRSALSKYYTARNWSARQTPARTESLASLLPQRRTRRQFLAAGSKVAVLAAVGLAVLDRPISAFACWMGISPGSADTIPNQESVTWNVTHDHSIGDRQWISMSFGDGYYAGAYSSGYQAWFSHVYYWNSSFTATASISAWGCSVSSYIYAASRATVCARRRDRCINYCWQRYGIDASGCCWSCYWSCYNRGTQCVAYECYGCWFNG